MGFTKLAHPVVIIPLAGLDLMGFIKTLNREEIVKVAVKIVEYHLNIAYEHSKKHGQNARKFVVLIDMDSFYVRQYLTKQSTYNLIGYCWASYNSPFLFAVLELAIMLAKLYEANYPSILQKVYIINGK